MQTRKHAYGLRWEQIKLRNHFPCSYFIFTAATVWNQKGYRQRWKYGCGSPSRLCSAATGTTAVSTYRHRVQSTRHRWFPSGELIDLESFQCHVELEERGPLHRRRERCLQWEKKTFACLLCVFVACRLQLLKLRTAGNLRIANNIDEIQ